jgi:hypothetical protein
MPPCVIVGDKLGNGTTWCAGRSAASAANPRDWANPRGALPSAASARRRDRKGAHLVIDF